MRLNQHKNSEADYQRANEPRRNITPQEQKLWLALRGEAKKLGFNFRRQQALHPYIVDFACLEMRLAIEVDGYSHDLAKNNDSFRTKQINQMGYTLLCFNNEDIDQAIEGVVAVILQHAQSLRLLNAPTPYPRPQGAGESHTTNF